MSDTPRTDFVAHESGDPEWNRFPNRFARMMAHAQILERENARLKKALDKYSEDETTIEAATLRLLIHEAITTMSHAEIFIESREKMHPTGVKLWGDLLDRMAIAVEPEQECGNESMKSIMNDTPENQ